MQLPDLINGLFEGFCIWASLMDIRAILKDKKVRGISVLTSVFFGLWSALNIFYYNNLDQVFSTGAVFTAGLIGICDIFLIYYYVRIERHKRPENKRNLFLGSLAVSLGYGLLGGLLIFLGSKYGSEIHRWTDIANAGFEFGGSLFNFWSCCVLMRDKEFKGGSIFPRIFYASWGTWNLYYYPHLGQYCSFFAGIPLFLGNCWYIWLIFYYRQKAAAKATVINEAKNGSLSPFVADARNKPPMQKQVALIPLKISMLMKYVGRN